MIRKDFYFEEVFNPKGSTIGPKGIMEEAKSYAIGERKDYTREVGELSQ